MPARAQVIGGGAHIHMCPGVSGAHDGYPEAQSHEWPCACTDYEWEAKECENCRRVREARTLRGGTGSAAGLSDHWG